MSVTPLCIAAYLVALACHALALLAGLAVLARFGAAFRASRPTRRHTLTEWRYATVAFSTLGNIFLLGALSLYVAVHVGALPPWLELVFALGHLFAAFCALVWHGLTYAEMRSAEGPPCGAA